MSKVKKSEYWKDIDNLLSQNKSPQYISQWLKTKGEIISYKTIERYRDNDFNIKAVISQKYNERDSKKRLEIEGTNGLNDLEKIDIITALVDPEIINALSEREQLSIFDKLLNTKYRILGVIDDKSPVNVKVDVNNDIPTVLKDPRIAADIADLGRRFRVHEDKPRGSGNG